MHRVQNILCGGDSVVPFGVAPSFAGMDGYSRTMQHPELGVVSYSLREVSDDPEQQVADVIGLMGQYVSEDLSRASLRSDVFRALQSSDPITDTWKYLRRGGDRGMRFVRDEQTYAPFSPLEFSFRPGRWIPLVESIARPAALADASDPQGDCDCFSGYGAAHLESRGVRTSFCTVAADSDDPSLFTHVYLVAYPSFGPYAGMRVPMDLSHGPYPGWEVSPVYRKQEWPMGSGGAFPWLAFGVAATLIVQSVSRWRGGVSR